MEWRAASSKPASGSCSRRSFILLFDSRACHAASWACAPCSTSLVRFATRRAPNTRHWEWRMRAWPRRWPTSSPSLVIEIDGGRKEYQLDPAEVGLKPADPLAVRGGGPEENARIAREVLEGAGGPRRDVVLLNAAAALRAAGRAKDWRDGIGTAAEAIDSGRAADVLQNWARISQE